MSDLDNARRNLARCQMNEQASLNKYRQARSRKAQLAKAAWLEAKAATVRAEVELAEQLAEHNAAA